MERKVIIYGWSLVLTITILTVIMWDTYYMKQFAEKLNRIAQEQHENNNTTTIKAEEQLRRDNVFDISRSKGRMPSYLPEDQNRNRIRDAQLEKATQKNGTRSLTTKSHLKKRSQDHRKNGTQHSVRLENRMAKLIHIKQNGSDLLLYTALLSNMSQVTTWDRLAITGWERRGPGNREFTCCVRFTSGLTKQFKVFRKVKRMYQVPLEDRQFVCNLSGSQGNGVATETTIVPFRHSTDCPRQRHRYLKIEYVYKHPGEIAIHAKILYGNSSVTDLLAWFELHKLMGFNMAVFYTFRLSPNVTKVLQHYRQQGKAEMIPFEFPESKYKNANMQKMTRDNQHFTHEGVTLLDGQERLRGYKYVVSFDIDEYILPTKNETWNNLFDRLCTKYPDAAGFKFGTYLYTTSWGATSNTSLFTVGRYLKRTLLTKDCVKHFTLPERLETGSIYAHGFTPKPDFKWYTVPETEGSLRHYRSCRRGYKNTKTKCFQFRRYTDDSLYKLFKGIERSVMNLKAELGV